MLRHFPFRTFAEINELGLEVEIGCMHCRRPPTEPIDLTNPHLRLRTIFGTRFVCINEIKLWDASPPRIYSGLGRIIIRPPSRDFVSPGRPIPWCSINCPRCVPQWEVAQAAKHLPPWDKIWTAPGVRLACPACRAMLTTVWHGGDGIPFTEEYRRVRSPSPPA